MGKGKVRSFSDYFWLSQGMLKFCGVLPMPERGLFVNYFLIMLSISSLVFLFFPGFYIIAFHGSEINAAAKVDIIAGEALEIWVTTIKALVLLPCRQTMLSVSRRATRLLVDIEDEKEQQLAEPYARRGYYLLYGFGGTVFFALLSIVIKPFGQQVQYGANGTILASKDLPYSIGIVHENQQLFNAWWIGQCFAGIIAIIAIIGIDTTLAIFVLHACGHFRILRSRFQAVAESKAKYSSSRRMSVSGRDDRRRLIDLIDKHQEIIHFCDEIEYVFRAVVLIQMILSISAICGFGFNLLAQEEKLLYGFHLLGACIQLLIFCWPPDNLIDESSQVGFEAYNLRWYDWIEDDKSLVTFLITRSQKPMLITAGRFTSISLETFSAVLSSAFSFFSILRKTL
ncbi:odorant receptor 300 isoform X1 [Nasonia vitripennis]|uniref:Odorant receptor n=1 Tax=Nasonia vitripennis TaxID=7425 RepID=A0A7M7M613_NASVI|nr:odorant receptor 300 isoform X1 [Nasonia vitripennis]